VWSLVVDNAIAVLLIGEIALNTVVVVNTIKAEIAGRSGIACNLAIVDHLRTVQDLLVAPFLARVLQASPSTVGTRNNSKDKGNEMHSVVMVGNSQKEKS
jgi:hypothetical protein